MLFASFLLMGSAFGQSEKACDELGWTDEIKSLGGKYDGGMGIEGVCGTEDDAICGKAMEFADAEMVCTDIGARLCTKEEYEALEAGMSGCNVEKKGRAIWTSTECGDGGREAVKLTEEGDATSECKTDKAYGGRCCADMGGSDLSAKTCEEMGWSDEVKTGGLGVEGVCGTKGEESVCGGEMEVSEAATICTDMGARLCTQEEYEALEAFDSGCKIEKKGNAVWTSTACTGEGEFGENAGQITVVLSKNGDATSECTVAGDKAFGGRCCADVGEDAGSKAPTMTPTEDPDAIDEIMAELMCIAASASKAECKVALPASVGRCKWSKNHSLEDRCQLKVFFGSCDGLNRKNCKKAVEEGRCVFADDDEKTCKLPEE